MALTVNASVDVPTSQTKSSPVAGTDQLPERPSDGLVDPVVRRHLRRRNPAGIGSHYRLAELVPADLAGTTRDLPTHFWLNGRLLGEHRPAPIGNSTSLATAPAGVPGRP